MICSGESEQILFELVTGKRAFDGGSLVGVLISVQGGPIPTPSAVVPDLPQEIDAFFQRALERDPARRFQSAQAMATAFLRLVKRLESAAEPTRARLSEARVEPSSRIHPTSSDISQVFARLQSIAPEEQADTEHAGGHPRGSPDVPLPPLTRAVAPPIPPPIKPRKAATSAPTLSSPVLAARGAKAPAAPAEPTARAASELIDQGFAAIRAGDREAAQRFWEAALRLDPANRGLELNLRKLVAKRSERDRR
jgi:eukaryotic-like serine/threonine-protein kinase